MIDKHMIVGSNLSDAWVKAFMKCYEAPGAVLSPALVSFPILDNTVDMENPLVRDSLDKYLEEPSKYPTTQSMITTIANTIFPEAIWRASQGDRTKLYEKYINILPLLKRCPANRNGIYFERMIMYQSCRTGTDTINQLEHVIAVWKSGNHRHSAHQVGIFNPTTDHSNQRQKGFPCLQQIAFKASNDGTLSVIAFYANQTLEEKAYGNYLGLFRLGKFMAKEMGLKLCSISCVASALKLNNASSKSRSRELVNRLKVVIDNATL